MAPNLSSIQHDMSRHLNLETDFDTTTVSELVVCSRRTIQRHRANLRQHGSTKTTGKRAGRRPAVNEAMLEGLKEHLIEKSDLYLDEMAVFLHDEFGKLIPISSIKRALDRAGWTKAVARRVAVERSADLRDEHAYNMRAFRSWQLIFVDESGCDKRVTFRRTAWSPKGTSAKQVTNTRRGDRYQILPAYTQDGVLLARIFKGTTDRLTFEDYIEQLLQHCNPFPGPSSVIVMDNARIHRGSGVERLCTAAGVKLIYLPPYSPDFNPIEELFSVLKAHIKRHWREFELDPKKDFAAFLERCLTVVGARVELARAHFEHAGVPVEDFCL
jgi:transposase